MALAKKWRNKLCSPYDKTIQNAIFVKIEKHLVLKKIISLLLFVLLMMASCKPASNVITSKQKAIELNRYNPVITESTKKNTAPKSKIDVDVRKETTTASETILPNTSAGIDEFENLDKVVYKSENADFRTELIESAQENLGSPYQTGGMSKNGFDCSGFVFTVFKNFDVVLPRTSNEMSNFGRALSKDEIRKGDLIFFKTNGNSKINHVGIVVESDSDGIKFIHSSTQKGVIISTTKEGYYQKTFAQVNRVVE